MTDADPGLASIEALEKKLGINDQRPGSAPISAALTVLKRTSKCPRIFVVIATMKILGAF